jgi:mannose-6-phosphate isomerase class I
VTGLPPLRLTAPSRSLVFGGHALARQLGKTGLPDWSVAETWEVSDVDGTAGVVTSGDLAGTPLRQLVHDHPEELMGRGWRGERFPLLTKFIDAAGTLPVHLHADDETAQRLEGEPNGKTEAWHILSAVPGATALCGTRQGVTARQFRRALEDQDFDAVLRRLPVTAGQTVYVPGGTPHSFGPDTLVYEIEQTSDVQQHAMHWEMTDGSPVEDEQWRQNIDAFLQQWKPETRPSFRPGLAVPVDDGVQRVFLTAGPYFALERWTAGTTAPLRHGFETALIVSNAGAPVTVDVGGVPEQLGRAETLLLPASCGELEISGPADVLFGYLPDLDADVLAPLLAAGYAPSAIERLGEGLEG